MLSILKSGAKLNKKRDINTNQANFSNINACKNLSRNLSQEPLPDPPPGGGRRKLRKSPAYDQFNSIRVNSFPFCPTFTNCKLYMVNST